VTLNPSLKENFPDERHGFKVNGPVAVRKNGQYGHDVAILDTEPLEGIVRRLDACSASPR